MGGGPILLLGGVYVSSSCKVARSGSRDRHCLVTGIVLSIMDVPVVLAKGNPIFQTSPLNDRFASPAGEGAHGFAKVRTVQQGSLVFDMIHAKNLEPNTTYQIHVVGAPGPFTVAGIETFKIVDVTTNGGGILHVKGIDLEFATPGEYRVDVIVTQDGYVAGSVTNAELYMVAAANNLDVLLACQPAFTVTVE